jgi:putative ABC transport system permease protein
MLAIRDNLAETLSALRTHKLRASLTMLGLTMGVATLITVVTIIQGANVYVEQKIANLGTNVFQIARTPFAVTDFNVVIKALKYRKIELDDMQEPLRQRRFALVMETEKSPMSICSGRRPAWRT